MKIGAAILAAGLSRRFGASNKLLSEVEGVALASRVAAAFLEVCQPDDVVAILGHEADKLQSALAGLPLRFALNTEYLRGMGTSIATAAAFAEESGWDGLMISPADLPWLLASDIRKVRQAFLDTKGERVVVPRFEGLRGHPVGFPKSLFAALRRLDADQGGRAIAEGEKEIRFVDTVSRGCVIDRDAPTR